MAIDKAFFARVLPALDLVFSMYLAPLFEGRLYNIVAPTSSNFPRAVYQSQDAGGFQKNKIGSNAWIGQITFRVMSMSKTEAWDKAIELAEALPALAHAHYDISADITNPQWFPIEKITTGNIYTAGLIVEFGVYPKDST